MKLLRGLFFIAGVVLAARQFGVKMGDVCERVFEKMPDDFPPKRMFQNVTAIREQNDRILSLLEEQAKTPA